MSEQIELAEKLDGAAVRSLQEALCAARGSPVVLDGGNVRVLGGLCAQLLLAAAQQWRAENLAFTLHKSDAVAADLSRLGMAAEFMTQDSEK